MRVRLVLVLATWATWCLWTHEAKAASLFPVPKTTEPSPQALGICKEKSKDDGQEFYELEGRCCQKCRPGFQVEKHCTSSTETTCRPCDNYTYSRHHNAHQKCFSCTVCREFDEVETQPCTTTNDTQCSCKNGTFCTPGHPCETCKNCRLSCPEGEVMMQACTPTGDMQCGPYATTPHPTPRGHNRLYWFLLLLVLPVLGVIVIFKVWRINCWSAAGANDSPVTWPLCKIFFQKRAQGPRGSCSQGPLERSDNERNEALLPPPPTHSNPSGSGGLERVSACGLAPDEECYQERNLIPANGRDPTEALRQSFDIFIENVPGRDWRRYMRALDLTENEITLAERDEKYGYEQQFLMLQTWLIKGGRMVTLKALLDTLCALELRGVESTIREALVSKDLYIYQE